jgi:UDP-N-acetylmuramate dehydrogenase
MWDKIDGKYLMVFTVYSLTSMHTFALPSVAQQLLKITSLDDLPAHFQAIKTECCLVLGEGSNTIFLENYQGTVVKMCLKGIDYQQTADFHQLTVSAGENWHELVLWCLQRNIFGLENLALIPGSVGAAPIQNIGAYGVEIERFIQKIEYYDIAAAKLKYLNHAQCKFAYRESIFKSQLAQQAVVTKVCLALPKCWQPQTKYGDLDHLVEPSAMEIFEKVVQIRQAKLPDPKTIPNAGSFFKNPIIEQTQLVQLRKNWPSLPSYKIDHRQAKIPAAWLIDTLGFKGKKLGGISCHPHQALVLTNDGSGTGQQLLQLARQIKAAVYAEFSIELENEVRLIGNQGAILL